jgi:hypothetical protein
MDRVYRCVVSAGPRIWNWVLAGGLDSEYVNARYLHYCAGIGFVAIGIWTLVRA